VLLRLIRFLEAKEDLILDRRILGGDGHPYAQSPTRGSNGPPAVIPMHSRKLRLQRLRRCREQDGRQAAGCSRNHDVSVACPFQWRNGQTHTRPSTSALRSADHPFQLVAVGPNGCVLRRPALPGSVRATQRYPIVDRALVLAIGGEAGVDGGAADDVFGTVPLASLR
jgi:hypothetical protein